MKILFIDDEFSRAVPLLRAGFDVYITCDIEVVRAYLEHCKFNLICLDHDMPKHTGYEIAQLCIIERNIPVIIHSMNHAGAKRISQLLAENAVSNKIIPIILKSFVSNVDAFIRQMNK